MWRSKARSFLLRSLRIHSQLQSQSPPKTLTLTQPSRLTPRLIPNPRFFSTSDATNPRSESNPFGIDESAESSETSSWSFDEPEPSLKEYDFDEKAVSNEASAWSFEETEVSVSGFDGEADKGDDLGVFEEEGDGVEVGKGEEFEDSSILEEEEGGEVDVEVAEIDMEQVENVVTILKGSSDDSFHSSLDKLELDLSEEFVIKVIEACDNVGGNLIEFYKWALEKDDSVKTTRAVEFLVQSVKIFPELTKMEAYVLWDLVKELGKEKWVLNTGILNELISMFWKLGKAKAGFEVFNKFDDFGCNPCGDSYYYTIQALGRRSMFDDAWSVCEKMLKSGILPDKEKIGEVITFFCKGKKSKEAHLVYLMAKEKNLCPQRSSLDFLIGGLTRNDETVSLALELLEDYPKGSFKHANKTFGAVVKGLCRVKKSVEAKKLLLRMVESGPAPGSASFNYVINSLSKVGEMEDAVALMRAMETRGLRPDVYTYTVVMSAYAKGGLMDEAYKIFCEAKKRHSTLSPATYHVLTRGYCKMEEFEKAVEIMKGMKEHGLQPNADEYNKMIETLCLKALDWRTAEKLLEEMTASGLHLKGVTCSLIAAVREIEEEETQPALVSIEG